MSTFPVCSSDIADRFPQPHPVESAPVPDAAERRQCAVRGEHAAGHAGRGRQPAHQRYLQDDHELGPRLH